MSWWSWEKAAPKSKSRTGARRKAALRGKGRSSAKSKPKQTTTGQSSLRSGHVGKRASTNSRSNSQPANRSVNRSLNQTVSRSVASNQNKIKIHPPARSGVQGRRTSGRKSKRVEMVDVHFFPFGWLSSKPLHKKKRKKPARKYGRGWGPSGRPLFSLFSLFYWGSTAVLWATIAFGALLLYYTVTLPDPLLAGLHARGQAIKVLADDGSLIAERGLSINYVRLEQLPKHVGQAVVAIEDRRFYSHWGFDPIGFGRAMFTNLKAGRLVQGGSTISQQLAKNLFLNSDRTVSRKLREMGMAFWLETKFDKNEILELYLNRVYLGHKTFGIDQAARRYFGKRAQKLTLSEAAMLAGLLKAPSRLNPKTNYRAAKKRAGLVLSSMRRVGYISTMTAKMARISPAKLRKRNLPINSNYIVDWIADLVPEYVTDFKSDLIIETSILKDVQDKANAKVRAYLSKVGAVRNVAQASLVMLSPDGAVRAMVGGRDYQASQFNRAIKSRRQTGSAFKPFVYLSALEAGFHPNSLVYDKPTRFNRWRPKNYKNKYRGQIKLRTALAFSSNVVAVKLMGTVGVVKTIETARRLGLRGEMKKDLSLALGTAEQSLLDLTSAYVPFANGGRGVLPYVIKSIRTSGGKVLYRHKKSDLGQVVTGTHVNELNSMMREVVRVGTGRNARLNGHDFAGKTGTTQKFKDGWFVGYSGHYIMGVWVGNDDGRSMKKVTGGGLPTRIWSDVMRFAHKGRSPKRMIATNKAPVVLNGWKEVGMVRRIRPQFFEKALQ